MLILIKTAFVSEQTNKETNKETNNKTPLTFRSSQCSTTGVTKTVVCAILSVEVVHIKEPLLLIEKSKPCGGSGFSSLAI